MKRISDLEFYAKGDTPEEATEARAFFERALLDGQPITLEIRIVSVMGSKIRAFAHIKAPS